MRMKIDGQIVFHDYQVHRSSQKILRLDCVAGRIPNRELKLVGSTHLQRLRVAKTNFVSGAYHGVLWDPGIGRASEVS